MAIQGLPPLFLIRRVMDSNDPRYPCFALVTTTYIRPPISLQEHPTFNLVEHPGSILDGGYWQIVGNKYPTGRWFPTQIYRPSRRQNATLFHNTEFAYSNRLWKQHDGTTIPCLTLKHAAGALPSAFYGIGVENRSALYSLYLNDEGAISEVPQLIPEENDDALVPQLVPEPSAPPSPSATLHPTFPQHLVNMIVEAAIQKGDTCPISFEPLTKTSARLTPCGHLVSHLAAEHWLSSAHSCPVCRTNLAKEYLMKWVG